MNGPHCGVLPVRYVTVPRGLRMLDGPTVSALEARECLTPVFLCPGLATFDEGLRLAAAGIRLGRNGMLVRPHGFACAAAGKGGSDNGSHRTARRPQPQQQSVGYRQRNRAS